MSNFFGSNGILYLLQKLKLRLADKVDKVEGKGLSTNDLTDELKQKILNAGDSSFSGDYNDLENKPDLTSLHSHANKAALDAITAEKTAAWDAKSNFSGSYNDLTDKPTIPADNKDLANGAGYQTAAQVETAITGKGYQTAAQVETAITGKGYQTADQVNSAITGKGYQTAAQVAETVANAGHITKEIVASLPAASAAKENVIYMVLKEGGSDPDYYDEYMLVEGKLELVGNSKTDLTGYYNTTNLQEITNAEIDTAWNSVFGTGA